MKSIGIFGGDLRQIYMANELCKQNHSVNVYGMSEHPLLSSCNHVSSFTDLIHQSYIFIGPIPFTSNGKTIHTIAQAPSDFTIDHLKKELQTIVSQEPLFLAGMIPDSFREFLSCIGISYYDFMKDECIAYANAVATAEGAIAKAIEKSSINLQESRSLIIGFGKCGKVLAQKVNALNSHVTICARKETARAEASSLGYATIDFEALTKMLPTYQYIYNTIPVVILTKERLLSVSRDTTIIDIASVPGGLDYTVAEELRLNATLYLGIPGKIAPKASAEILINKIRPLL